MCLQEMKDEEKEPFLFLKASSCKCQQMICLLIQLSGEDFNNMYRTPFDVSSVWGKEREVLRILFLRLYYKVGHKRNCILIFPVS